MREILDIIETVKGSNDWWPTSDHDVIFLGIGDAEVEVNSNSGKRLRELNCLTDEDGNWYFYT
jgi:hypothetical protein